MGQKSQFLDHFFPSHQNFTQNFARNSKIWVLKILVQKWQKICSFQGPKIDFGIQWHYRIFWHVSKIQKSQPICRRQKVEVDSTPSAPCRLKKSIKSVTKKRFWKNCKPENGHKLCQQMNCKLHIYHVWVNFGSPKVLCHDGCTF